MANGNHNKGNSFDRKTNFQNEIIYFGYNSRWIRYNNIIIKIVCNNNNNEMKPMGRPTISHPVSQPKRLHQSVAISITFDYLIVQGARVTVMMDVDRGTGIETMTRTRVRVGVGKKVAFLCGNEIRKREQKYVQEDKTFLVERGRGKEKERDASSGTHSIAV